MRRKAHYTIGELAALSGATARALRHYEDMGLLAPKRDANGYRTYETADAKRLAQVLSMRSCGLPLTTIKELLEGSADVRDALVAHLDTLHAHEGALADAIQRSEAALTALERIEGMETKDAFEAMKQEGLARFEGEYGPEARQLYGNDAIDAANERMMSLSRDEWDAKELLEESIKVQLRLAMADGDPTCEAASELARMHARWIRIHWGSSYTREAHLGLARGYLCDERFRAYYDGACGEGATDFLVQSLEANL